MEVGDKGSTGFRADLLPNVVRHEYVHYNCIRLWTVNCNFELPSSLLFLLLGSEAGVLFSHQRATGWSDWCRHIDRNTEAWLKTNGIGLDPCFINTAKAWHYVIAAMPVVISLFFMFICLQLNELALGHNRSSSICLGEMAQRKN